SGRSKTPINRRRNVIGRFASRKGRARPSGVVLSWTGEWAARWTHQGRRAHERSLGRGVRTGPRRAPARHAARAGRAYSDAGPHGRTARASAGAAKAPGERAQRVVSLRGARDVRYAGDRGGSAHRGRGGTAGARSRPRFWGRRGRRTGPAGPRRMKW